MWGANKKLEKGIDFISNNGFYLKGRRISKDLKKVTLKVYGVLINTDDLNNSFTMKNSITFDDDKLLELTTDTDTLASCLSLGKFIYNNEDLINEFMLCYRKEITKKMSSYIAQARNDDSAIKGSIIPNVYKCLNITKVNSIKFSSLEYTEPKLLSSKTFNRQLLRWIKACGLNKNTLASHKHDMCLLTEDLLYILDFCLDIYSKYRTLIDSGSFEERINTTMTLSYRNNKVSYKQTVYTLRDFCLISLPTVVSNSKVKIKVCQYCGSLFIHGKISKKCCSDYCKDMKNRKYEKRKERKEGRDKECCKKQI